ncbi:hypothetical protein WMF38_29510 [Sorangium sp. So ce118]
MTKKRPAIALLMDYARSEYQAELRFGAERAAEAPRCTRTSRTA